jgi:hypothetical protein
LLMNFLVTYQLTLLFVYYIYIHIERNISIIQDTEVAIIWPVVMQIERISTVPQIHGEKDLQISHKKPLKHKINDF